MVALGLGNDAGSFGSIRAVAAQKAKTPAQGGDEMAYLNAILDARLSAMKARSAQADTSRVDSEQRTLLQAGNLDLHTPLTWKVSGKTFSTAP